MGSVHEMVNCIKLRFGKLYIVQIIITYLARGRRIWCLHCVPEHLASATTATTTALEAACQKSIHQLSKKFTLLPTENLNTFYHAIRLDQAAHRQHRIESRCSVNDMTWRRISATAAWRCVDDIAGQQWLIGHFRHIGAPYPIEGGYPIAHRFQLIETDVM